MYSNKRKCKIKLNLLKVTPPPIPVNNERKLEEEIKENEAKEKRRE